MQNSKTPKTLLIIVIILILLILGGIGYYFWKIQKQINNTPDTINSNLRSASPTLSSGASPSSSISPTVSPTISPKSSSDNFQIPQGETYEISSKADTNGDSKEETLVVTKKADGKYHAYILSVDGAKLFDNQDLGQKPLRIATQIYGANEKYVSWMLVFTEESGSLAFIHWNGTKYEIPQDNLGI